MASIIRSRWEQQAADAGMTYAEWYDAQRSGSLVEAAPMALTVREPTPPMSAAVIDAKAVTGPGVFPLTYHQPIHSFSRDPNRLMAEAQVLFHSNGWVAAAERALGGRFLRMDWHLEDPNGKTIDAKSEERYQEPLRLLQRPSKERKATWSTHTGLTFRHLGLPGNAIWVLDQMDMAAKTPLQILYVNPARLEPKTDTAGNLVGWLLDGPNNQAVNARRSDAYYREGIPLEVDEVVHFKLDEPDWGIWGVGIPEAAQRKIELDRLSDVHAGGVLASGGRLSGLVTPKDSGNITDDQWAQFTRDWRSITSDPDAAKRLQIAKMPLDFTQMTASPKDLQLMDVSKQGRDDILAEWGVPVAMLGINVPDDGDRADADKEVIWESIKHRADKIRETIQYEILDRWQALDVGVTLVFEYPEFEDDSPRYEAAAKSISVAITNDERRAILGLEPLEDKALGQAIWIDNRLVRIDEPPQPESAPPSEDTPSPEEQSVAEPTDDETEVLEGKARSDAQKLLGLRQRTEVEWEPKVRKVIQTVLGQQQRMVAGKLEHALSKKDLTWWNPGKEDRRILSALEPLLTEMAADVAQRTTRTISKPAGKADTWLERVIEAIRTSVGARITGINQTTRDKIQRSVQAAAELGLSPAQLGDMIEETGAFNEARAEMIARTETGTVFNQAAVESYRQLDVERVQVIDGDSDDACASANGAEWSIEEALANPLQHPSCVRDFIPVV